ncbi:hypothetical protein [Methylomagnum ishizawai]|uniref:hypothetical protein n=1 Tax=Methylomagnum ishizawai TaxID=1760988 RepID=UPI001C338F11|nr:hypothetical protein [Methylomagnum ishizawai]BBL77447.1 hypothetical protein MishRS11D_45450 [Methylomagnum ishizawai]
MKTITIPPREQKLLDCLTQAVAEALERKRRLGQYAVVWREGKPVFVGEDSPPSEPVATNPTP